jgi:transposase
MALLSVIRCWALRDQLSIREIARRTGLSRNTIRKHDSRFRRPSKLDAFADQLARWLKAESSKPRKQKRTLKKLQAGLFAVGYEGSYGRVAAFARAWKAERQREQQTSGRGTFVPLAFQPGEAFQFDASEDWAIIGGERMKLQVAHFKLSHC